MSLMIFIVFSPVYGIQIHAIVVMRIESTRQHVNKWHESARIAGKEAMQAQSFGNRICFLTEYVKVCGLL